MKAAAKENNHWGRAARVFRRCATTSMVATIVLALLWGSVLAAEQATTENADAPPKYEVPEDEFGRGSPRGTVKGYLAACREGDYEKAANYLDLRRIPGDGPTLARQLRVTLSRTLWVDVEALSPEHGGRSNEGLPSYRDRLGTINTQEGQG